MLTDDFDGQFFIVSFIEWTAYAYMNASVPIVGWILQAGLVRQSIDMAKQAMHLRLRTWT